MYRVLLPVDENTTRARAQVDALLEFPAGEELAVDVVHVRDEATGGDVGWAVGGFSEEYAEEMAEIQADRDLPASVETAVDTLADSDARYAVHETAGDAAEKILEAADEFDVDAIVLGVSRRSPVGKVLFGSVAQAVILESERPVTVVPA